MLTESQIDYMLDQWRREYGIGGMPRAWHGISPMQTIADFHGKAPRVTGFLPQVMLGTVADDVERAVNAMLSLHPLGFMVLRCEYMGRQDRPWEAKQSQLSGLGFRIDRDVYDDVMASAKVVLAEILSVPNLRYEKDLTAA